MKEETRPLQTLRTLILKSQSESLSEEETAQLNELILSEGGAEEAAALLDQLCAFNDAESIGALPFADTSSESFGGDSAERMLADSFDGPPESAHASTRGVVSRDPSPAWNGAAEAPEGDRPRRMAKWGWGVGLVASHLIIGTLAWSLARPASEAPSTLSLRPVDPSSKSQAHSPQLVSMTACVWRPSGDSVPTLHRPIQFGEVLDLVEGIAELKVREGTQGEAQVRIEGPASVFIRADGHLGLRHGSLTAKSLGTGSGQVILDTPIGEVLVDGQSSVGLVSDGAINETHVFTGQAFVKPAPAVKSETIRLESGEAVRFSSEPEKDFEVVIFEASMSKFVSARSSGFDPLEVGKKYIAAVQESKPSIYWRFEKLVGEETPYIANEGSYPGAHAAIIGESAWRRYGENRVAQLGQIGMSSGFRSTDLWPPEPIEEYTVELWAKPELFHHGEMLCMHESIQEDDGRYPHNLLLETLAHHWNNPLEYLKPNRIRFVHRFPASGEVSEGSNLVPPVPYEVRTWQHVAACNQGDRVSLWINGQLAAENFEGKPLSNDMQIVVGQLYLSRIDRRFVGQIDEIAIYDRCLSPRELRTHIEAAGRRVDPPLGP